MPERLLKFEMEEPLSGPPAEAFVVIDVGCHECGVKSEPVGIFLDEFQAQKAQAETDSTTDGWRDGGQTYAEVFRMTLPH